LWPRVTLQCKPCRRRPAIPHFFGEKARSGAVETGKTADLVLLRAKPLDNSNNTQQITAIVLEGRYFSRKDLDALLNGVKAAAAHH
jgi:hypothetical protein